jgi:EGF-domain serine glucosyl/xylosyltransferase
MRVLFLLFIFIFNNAYGVELKTITSEEFTEQNSSSDRKIIVDFITGQFKDRSVSQAKLDKVWKDSEAKNILHMVRFQIVNQKLYVSSSNLNHIYLSNLVEYFQKFVKRYKVKDVDFIIYARDEIPPNNIREEILAVPAFMMFRNLNSPYEKDKFLLPDSTMLKDSWGELAENIETSNQNYSWYDKIERFFWRGSSTGGEARYMYNINNFDKFARLKLVMLSKLYPDLIDARFIKPIFSDNQTGRDLRRVIEGLFSKNSASVKAIDHLRYKYLLSLDGNSATGTRVPWIMLSNSILIKQDSQKIEWFYPALKPYVHYIPIKEDLTDIFMQLQWMQENDKEVQKISDNASDFVKNNLMPEHIDVHMSLILDEYQSIQKDKEIIATLPPVEELFSFTSLIKFLFKRVADKFLQVFN